MSFLGSLSLHRSLFQGVAVIFDCRTTVIGVLLAAFSASLVEADVFNMPTGQTSLEFVAVGDPGNRADSASYWHLGAVGHTCQIGKYEVTIGQYCEFLNAVARTDTYGLYSTGFMSGYGMGTYYATIKLIRSGSSGSYSYSCTGTYSEAANCPVFDVSWGDAARFCNWLHNGQPTGDQGPATTETGAYALNGAVTKDALKAVTRSPGAKYFIPSESEWYKAAFYKGGGSDAGYWLFPTQSNIRPSNVLSSIGTNNANYYDGTNADPINKLTPVGYFAGSPGAYGTFDMSGNIMEWNENAILPGGYRDVRGGSWCSVSSEGSTVPTNEDIGIGFRIASVPEPSTLVLAGIGVAGLLAYRWRHRGCGVQDAVPPHTRG